MSDDELDTLCFLEETVFCIDRQNQWHSRNEGIENRKYQDDQPHAQSQPHAHCYDNSSP